MKDISSKKHPSKRSFQEFIAEIVDQIEFSKPHSSDYAIVDDTKIYRRNLEDAYEKLSSLNNEKKISSSGVEWFLDNYFVIQEAIELIRDDLPENFFKKLPSADANNQVPRIYYLAQQVIDFYRIELVQNDLDDFLIALQKSVPLKMSELWALPLMLRLVLIEIVSETVRDLLAGQNKQQNSEKNKVGFIETDEIVARVLRTLLFLDRVDWKDFFELHSKVEKILRDDPARVYQRMDFETRDKYRKKVEEIADRSKRDEFQIAEMAIRLAEEKRNEFPGNKKLAHVGFYLIDQGLSDVKTKVEYKESTIEIFFNYIYKNNTAIYLSAIIIITLLVDFLLLFVSRTLMADYWQVILLGFISLIPASSVAVNLINSIITATLPPKTLPKMDFSKKIPREFRSAIVIPALLSNIEELNFLLKQIELHYLSNKDRNICYALLTDFSDGPQETMLEDKALLSAAVEGIRNLNERYQSDYGSKPFYFFHRRRQWNPQEDAWIGWERKRGKLADFNRFLLENFKDSYSSITGDLDFIREVRFVITVDADTLLPRGSAKTLIATLAHPLNQPEFKEESNRVISGYTILQPRTEVKPTTVTKSLFTRVFAGDLGLDLYTRAVSDIYQDLFDEGIYVGKGIYDVAAFQRSLKGKVPDNALLSHDLFEGLQGRAGLVSDVVFFEEFPPEYGSQVQRRHRWVRGDWQLLPWLLPEVPAADGSRQKNPFKTIDKWKMVDNLRRSLLEPITFLSFLTGWLILNQGSWAWTALMVFISAFPLLRNIVSSVRSRFFMGARSNLIANIRTAFFRWIFWLIFLPYETIIMVDAIATTMVRVFFSRKRLLQWQTSAHTIRVFGRQHKIGAIWLRMISAPIISIIIGVLLSLINPSALLASLPLLLLWFFSPQIAYWISLKPEKDPKVLLSDADLKELRLVARMTWLFFERFIGPEDHWLPPDHYQADPKAMVAHRTSPTNIGLMLLSSAAAYDFGYIGALDFIYRMDYTFETLDELEKYRGHLLNWYDTNNLKTLAPRYVSTVDSGNFAISLIGLYQSLMALYEESISPENLFLGVCDSLDIFCNIVEKIDDYSLQESARSLHKLSLEIQRDIIEKRFTDTNLIDLIGAFEQSIIKPLSLLVNEILNFEEPLEKFLIKDLRHWFEAISNQLVNIKRQTEALAPWILSWQERPDMVDNLINERSRIALKDLLADRALTIKLSDLPDFCTRTITFFENFIVKESFPGEIIGQQADAFIEWIKGFVLDLEKSKKQAEALLEQMKNLMEKINFYIERMEFNFLFDKDREVFNLGYTVGTGKLDNNHYDLLASEARTASLFAIAQNEVPRSHWLHMSRPFTLVSNSPTLLSWNGSMFEYLMPNLFTRTYPGTLLYQTSRGVVNAQIDYAAQNKVPWGISESSYFHFDRANNYQYKGFGVPGLGRKRGLAEELVIAPYASLLAVGIEPKAVLKNINTFKEMGVLNQFGFYESIDYTTSRMPIGQEKAIVKSYMAHHQGMVLIALANFLNPKSIVDRVHADPRIQSTELLLQEQIPQAETIQKTEKIESTSRKPVPERFTVNPWSVDLQKPGKSVNVLSNGKTRLFATESGSGYLESGEIALTRWRNDAISDSWGIWFYLQDMEEGKFWSIGKQPVRADSDEYRVFYAPHMIEIRQVIGDIRVICQTAIAPKEDICLHKFTVTNQSDTKRQYRLISFGEVVLAQQERDRQHPAFNKMFIESKFIDSLNMLFYERRKRSSDEESHGMSHLIYDEVPGVVEYESDRHKFIGRNHHIHSPIILAEMKPLSGTVGTTLDPIFSLSKLITLDPHQAAEVTYLTMAASGEQQAVEWAEKYQSQTRINNAFTAAESQSEKLLRALDLNDKKLLKFQEVLSRVIYPVPALRVAPDILEKNTLGQSGLWSFGISGDYPILLILIDRQEDIKALHEVLLGHAYWRKLGLMIDLVILNTKDSGYTHELNERIHRAINIMDGQGYVNQRGGIYVLTASQMDAAPIVLLKTAASVVFDLKLKDLEDYLQQARTIAPHLPSFVSTASSKDFSIEKSLRRPENLILDNGIGGFTPAGKEYQIYLEDFPTTDEVRGQITPAPWINVIANKRFGFLISESGGGYTWAENSGENRLTPWTNDPVSDPTGESLYLRDEITGEIWSPTPYPSGNGVDYLVRHGQGYSVFESFNQGFKQEMKVFVDTDEPIKVIELKLENLTDKNRRVTATYYVEWVLGSFCSDTKQFIIPAFDDKTGSLTARNTYSEDFSAHIAFLTSDQPVHGITADRAEFLGSPGNRKSPAGLKRIGLSGKAEAGGDICGALQIHLDFEPGEEKTFRFILGQGENPEQTAVLANKFSDGKYIEQSWENIRRNWDTLLGKIVVETPDMETDLMLNRWLPYQALSCRIWGRSAFYQSSGAYGFRDQLQDITSILSIRPEIARHHILRAARHQFDAGDVLHWWHPPSGRGVRTKISDDMLWLVYVTAEYVSKTGDIEILDEEIPFLTGEPLKEDEEERYGYYATSEETYTLFEHCRRALEHGDTQGPHGLPLIAGGDWNDGMNRVGIEDQGESVWLAWFLIENQRRFAELCKIKGETSLSNKHRDRASQLREVIDQAAWDGKWYLRAYYDDGTPLGSHRNEECKIDSLPQSWSVLTNGTDGPQGQEAMKSFENHLVDHEARIIRLFTPPFDETQKDPGYIKGYPPGIRENGGQYTHAAIWAVWALTELGLGDKAYQLFEYLNPVTHSWNLKSANQYTVEPYVVAADVYSKEPYLGRGGWTWYTGSSGWLYRLGMEAILGFRQHGDHFTIEPCIPANWESYQINFKAAHSSYEVHVQNPDHTQKGVKQMTLDGKMIEDHKVLISRDGKSHRVTVIMGEK